MHSTPSLLDGVDGTARRRTTHRAASTVIPSMMGVSIISAILGADPRGTTQSVRMVPSTKRAPNTSAK
jgi:hypothetical protein